MSDLGFDVYPDQSAQQPQGDLGFDVYSDHPDTSAMKSYVKGNLAQASAASKEAGAPAADNKRDVPKPRHPAEGFIENLEAGLQMSVSGLITHGDPTTITTQDAPFLGRIASQVGMFAGDAPFMLAGAVAGGVAGAPLGPRGAKAMAGAGAFAVPAAMRKMFMDHYERGDIQTGQELVDRMLGTAWETIKSGTVGAATTLTGGTLAAAGYGPLAQKSAEVAVMASISKALEGKVPDANDFLDAAVLVGGLHAVGAASGPIASKIRNIYAETGVRPEEVVRQSNENPSLKQELNSSNIETPKIEVPSSEAQNEIGLRPVGEKVDTEGNPHFEPHQTADEEAAAEVPKSLMVQTPEAEEKAAPPEKPTEYDEAAAKIDERFGKESDKRTPFKQWLGDTWNNFYRHYVDSLDPLKRKLNGKELPADQDPYKLGREFAAYISKVDVFHNKNTIDFETQNPNGEGLKPILENVDFGKLRRYWASRQALDLNARGIETGFDIDAAKTVVAQDVREFQPIVDRLVSYKNRVLKYYADSGMIDHETYQNMVDANKNHASFYRIVDDEGAPAMGKGQLLKAIKGSDAKIHDPIASTFLDTERLVQAADRNNVMQKAVVALEDEFEKNVTPSKAITVSDEELKAEMERQGIDATPESMQIFRKSYQPLDRSTQIQYFEDGKRLVFDTTPDMAEALNGLGQNPAADGLFLQIARPFARVARALTTGNPAFALRHVIRSQFFAGTYSEAGQTPFLDALKSIWKNPEDQRLWQQFVIDGGVQGSLEKLDREYFDNHLAELNEEAPFFSRAVNYIKTKAELSEAFIRAADNLNRFAEYKKSLEGIENPSLADRKEAAFRAREVGIDYSRSGAKMAAISQISAFFNAKVQGMDLMGRKMAEDPVGFSLKVAKWVTVPTVLAWAASHNDERYKSTPEWQKMLYWVIPIDHWRDSDAAEAGSVHETLRRQKSDGTWEINDGPVLRIPKPPVLGQLFGSSIEAALNAMVDKDRSAAKGLGEALLNELPVMPIPNLIQAPLEQLTNHSFLTGSPIVPASKEKVLPELQYTEYTSDTAKALGKMISYVPGVRSIGPGNNTLSSPMVLENYIGTWGGTLGRYALQIADKGLISAGVVADPVKPASTIADMPFAKEFTVRYPSAKSQQIEEFLERTNRADSINNSVKMLMKAGDYMGAQSLSKGYANESLALDGIKAGLEHQNHLVQMINQNPKISPTQKRQLMDGVYYQMIQAADRGNKMLDELEKAQNEKH